MLSLIFLPIVKYNIISTQTRDFTNILYGRGENMRVTAILSPIFYCENNTGTVRSYIEELECGDEELIIVTRGDKPLEQITDSSDILRVFYLDDGIKVTTKSNDVIEGILDMILIGQIYISGRVDDKDGEFISLDDIVEIEY